MPDPLRLPAYQLITRPKAWQNCLAQLKDQPIIGIDLEANSMYAYRERVCLAQISIPHQDFIVDPVALPNLDGLGEILANPQQEKIFHSAEYDLILLKREYDWEINNLFDTMWAARILGYPRVGLASLLEEIYHVTLNKRYQRANWCHRPLTEPQLVYAQADTHFLIRLRQHLAEQLTQNNQMAEATEIFIEHSRVHPNNNEFNPDSFWSISGATRLPPSSQAVLKALHVYRNQEAQQRNQPLFKIFSDRTLLELARNLPHQQSDLRLIHGMSSGQIHRYGQTILRIIRENEKGPSPRRPRRQPRLPDDVVTRYEKLHNWRKERGIARGVESDVIMSREALWAFARANPKTLAELEAVDALGPWRLRTYGADILQLLNEET